jgi:uncharacterized protein (DUF305 family)
MQGMILHHAQALTMSAMIPTHTGNPAMQLLGQRITVSQRDEIKLMERWLRDHHAEVPSLDQHQHHMPAGLPMLMPGMLTGQQLHQLDQARGAEFDRLFLQFMIQHHEGALTMVGDLFATQGAGQEPEMFRFASDVDADQRAEIKRMRAMLGASHSSPQPKPQ